MAQDLVWAEVGGWVAGHLRPDCDCTHHPPPTGDTAEVFWYWALPIAQIAHSDQVNLRFMPRNIENPWLEMKTVKVKSQSDPLDLIQKFKQISVILHFAFWSGQIDVDRFLSLRNPFHKPLLKYCLKCFLVLPHNKVKVNDARRRLTVTIMIQNIIITAGHTVCWHSVYLEHCN